MKELKIIGIDLAKSSFHLYGAGRGGKRMFSRRLSRAKVADFVAKMPPCVVAMEACSGAHFWGRKFQAMGHEVKLIAPQFVKPFVKSQKNDAADAEAIAEAASRENMRFVALKQLFHQDIQSVHRIRRRVVESRTSLSNEIRGLLAEYGIPIPRGVAQLRKALPEILSEQEGYLTLMAQHELQELYHELLRLDEQVKSYDNKINEIAKQNPICQKLQKLRGVGPLTSTAVVAATVEPGAFKNGRQYSAWLGLVPQQFSTGGRTILCGISKRGDRYIRTLLIHGARASLVHAKTDDARTQWALKLKERKGTNKAAVALANKNARVLWAIMANKSPWQTA